jgi:anionic cell wall polymer biosynthesis LytR-Cps2A-Psr (LCP) family protein
MAENKGFTMKTALRIAAGIVLVAVLFMMGSTQGPSPLATPAAVQPLPEAPDLLGGMLVFRKDVMSVLVCVTSISSGMYGNGTQPIELYLLTLDERNNPSLLNIPVGTRVSLTGAESISGAGYDTPIAAYFAGLEEGLAAERLCEAVSELLGGIRVDLAMMMSDDGFIALVDALGGVRVRRDSVSLSVGGSVVADEEDSRPMRLTGLRTLAYIAPGTMGTDIGALDRQNHALAAVAEGIGLRELSFAQMEQVCGDDLAHNLSEEEKARLDDAFSGMTFDRCEAATVTLEGAMRILGGQSWLPDRLMLKEYILEKYYRDAR